MPKDKLSTADREDLLDGALASTFPASDPVSFTSTAIATTDEAPLPKTPAKSKTASKEHKLYAANGGGSMIVEASFAFTTLPLTIVDVPWSDTGRNSKALKGLNPLGQVPTLILPDGSVMTESAAIVLYLADKVKSFELVPPPGDKQRAAFLRWLVFLVSAVYPTFTYGDVPERWVGEPKDKGAGKALVAATDEHRKTLWRFVETQVKGPWFLGTTFSALDIYLWPMTAWRPGRDWFKAECPKLYAIGTATKAHPAIKKVAARNKL